MESDASSWGDCDDSQDIERSDEKLLPAAGHRSNNRLTASKTGACRAYGSLHEAESINNPMVRKNTAGVQMLSRTTRAGRISAAKPSSTASARADNHPSKELTMLRPLSATAGHEMPPVGAPSAPKVHPWSRRGLQRGPSNRQRDERRQQMHQAKAAAAAAAARLAAIAVQAAVRRCLAKYLRRRLVAASTIQDVVRGWRARKLTAAPSRCTPATDKLVDPAKHSGDTALCAQNSGLRETQVPDVEPSPTLVQPGVAPMCRVLSIEDYEILGDPPLLLMPGDRLYAFEEENLPPAMGEQYLGIICLRDGLGGGGHYFGYLPGRSTKCIEKFNFSTFGPNRCLLISTSEQEKRECRSFEMDDSKRVWTEVLKAVSQYTGDKCWLRGGTGWAQLESQGLDLAEKEVAPTGSAKEVDRPIELA